MVIVSGVKERVVWHRGRIKDGGGIPRPAGHREALSHRN